MSDLDELNAQMPEGVKVIPFDHVLHPAPEGGPEDCDGSEN